LAESAALNRAAGEEVYPTAGSMRRGYAMLQFWSAICPGVFESARADDLGWWLAIYRQTALPLHEQVDRIRAALSRVDRQSDEAAMLRGLMSAASGIASLTVCEAALGAELYRIEHGDWPAGPTDGSGAAPVDPFSGEPLRYAATPAGRMVYSVGENGRDDGGECDYEETDDIVFRLFDADRRNAPPPGGSPE
jgi:hypothetical protein